jgi:hypothetical protein
MKHFPFKIIDKQGKPVVQVHESLFLVLLQDANLL